MSRLFFIIISFVRRIILRAFDCVGIVNVLYYSGHKPYKKYRGDAGFDLTVASNVNVGPSAGVDVPVETVITSRRMWLLLIGRSSTFFNRGLLVNTAIIDGGYSGALKMFVYNPSNKSVFIAAGERIGQVIPFRLNNVVLMEGVYCKNDGRGKKGFGSSGV